MAAYSPKVMYRTVCDGGGRWLLGKPLMPWQVFMVVGGSADAGAWGGQESW